MTHTLFVSCASYVEPFLKQELVQLGYPDVKETYRGVFVNEVSFDAVYHINYCSRLASRVFLPIKKFFCSNRQDLYENVYDLSWKQYFRKAHSFAIDATVDPKVFRSSLFAAQIVKDAICDQLREETGKRPNVSPYEPDVQLNLFMQGNKAILSFDTSGSALHKREYRQESGEAPLQETLAAALLTIAKFQGDEIVYDPCCGSGTLLIEAALMASNTPAQFFRKKFGFMNLPEFSEQAWLKIKNQKDSERKTLSAGHFFGTEINRNAYRICQANLRAVNLHREIQIIQSDFREVDLPTAPNFIICNPPYGNRLNEDPSLVGLYRALGDLMKRKAAKPARGFVFTGNLELAKEVGLAPKQRHVLLNGGIESRLLEFDLY
ncbi:putative RNA methyltransferase slr0064 [Chlamydiales bacterium STE3]|nr:putative RNA methyltransferase slr0064 [Chlamydiales bacterium STE3]